MQYSDDSDEREAEPPEYEGLGFDQYKNWWREAVDGYAEPRRQHIRDEEYHDGDVKGTGWGHWTETQLTTLTGRKQPPTTRNIIARKVNAICGVEQRSRSEPRALPRTPKDQKAAEIATDALRYIKDQTRWINTKGEKVLEAVKIGFAAVEIGGAEDHVPVTGIDWKDFFFDPRSRKFDFSDARYMGVAKWLDLDVAMQTYAGPELPKPEYPPQPPIPPQPQDPMFAMQWAEQAQALIGEWQAMVQQIQAAYEREAERRQKIVETLESTSDGGGSDSMAGNSEEFEDRPSNTWTDTKRRRVFVVDMWHQDAKHGWFRCVFTGKGKLFTQPSPYKEKDDWGRVRPACPIKAFSIHVSKDLWRMGEVRGMRSTQDEVNFRLSKKLHYLATNQLFYEPGAFEDGNIENVRAELSKPDGLIPVRNIGAIKVEKNLDIATALDSAMDEAMRFLDAEGANLELQGKGPGGASGRAILARQQAGLGQLGPLFDRIHDWELRCYRAMWARVQQFWTGPMYVRVTDDKNAARFAAVNGAPVIHSDNGNQAQPQQPGQPPQMPQMPPQGDPMGGAMLGHNGGPPMTPEDMGETGPMLAELDMDIIIDRAPEAATLQAEQFEELARLAGTGLFNSMPPADVARMMITASSLPNKSELLDMLDKVAAQPQQPNPAQIHELKLLVAKVEKMMADTQKTKAETAQIAAEIPKSQAEAALAGAEARTANVNATMTEHGASRALAFDASMLGGAPSYQLAPQAAADTSGALGLPPSEANGPPPF